MLLRHRNSAGEGAVEVQPDASLSVAELLGYELLKVFGATVADLKQVLDETKLSNPLSL